jgi:hypothetical protein
LLNKTVCAAGLLLAGDVVVVVVVVVVIVVVAAAPASLDAVADVVSQAQRPGRGSSLNLAQ